MTNIASKPELRRHFLALRQAIPLSVRLERDLAILQNIRKLECYRQALGVASYASDGVEPDLFGLWREKRFFLPRYRKSQGIYELVEVEDRDRDLVPGKFGILEPRAELPALPLEQVVSKLLFLVPAVACSRSGVRLGRGGGYYDRMLSGVTSPVIGVVYHCQLTGWLPAETHDRPVDVVVTEEELIEIRN